MGRNNFRLKLCHLGRRALHKSRSSMRSRTFLCLLWETVNRAMIVTSYRWLIGPNVKDKNSLLNNFFSAGTPIQAGHRISKKCKHALGPFWIVGKTMNKNLRNFFLHFIITLIKLSNCFLCLLLWCGSAVN